MKSSAELLKANYYICMIKVSSDLFITFPILGVLHTIFRSLTKQ
jgi:hypothetical protein